MPDTNLEKYLLPFLKKESVRSISHVKRIGILRSSVELLKEITNDAYDFEKLKLEMEKKDFDVRVDDIIEVFSYKAGVNDYYAFIFDPLELYSKTFLIKSVKIS